MKPQKCGHERVLEKTTRNPPILKERRLVDVTVGSGQTNIMTDVSQRPMGVLHSPDHGQDAPIEDKKV